MGLVEHLDETKSGDYAYIVEAILSKGDEIARIVAENVALCEGPPPSSFYAFVTHQFLLRTAWDSGRTSVSGASRI